MSVDRSTRASYSNSMRTLQCPKCSTPMQTFNVVALDSGPQVELDRCPSCGVQWFDAKELERVAGRPYLARLDGNASTLACPICQGPMTNSLVGGELPVDECKACHGALLDSEGVRPLTGKAMKEVAPPLPKPTKPPPLPKKRTAQVVSYSCERCQKPVKMGEGGTVKGAFVCRECELKPWPDQRQWDGGVNERDFSDALFRVIDDLFN